MQDWGQVNRAARLLWVGLALLALGACSQLSTTPTEAAAPTVTELPQSEFSAQATGVWATIPAWAYSNGWAIIDQTWATGGRGRFIIDNRSSNAYSFVQFRSGTQPWVASPEYVAPGVRKAYNWNYPGAQYEYSFRICAYVNGRNTCGAVRVIRPG